MLYAAFEPDDYQLHSNYNPSSATVEVKGFSDNRKIKQDEKSISAIIQLQEKMQSMESALDRFPVTHHFAPGCYAREMLLPADHTIIGKIHKHAHLNIISKGKVIVSTEDGKQELEGPCTFTSYAGTKRAVYAIEDTVWTTIHTTEETDLEKIEEEIIAESFDELRLVNDAQGVIS